MGLVNIKDGQKVDQNLLRILSNQVEAASTGAATDINGMMSCFVELDSQLLELDAVGLDKESSDSMRTSLNKFIVHMQCFDLLAQKLAHVKSALELIDAEIPPELNAELSCKLDSKIKRLYSSSQELNVHLGVDDGEPCAASNLF